MATIFSTTSRASFCPSISLSTRISPCFCRISRITSSFLKIQRVTKRASFVGLAPSVPLPLHHTTKLSPAPAVFFRFRQLSTMASAPDAQEAATSSKAEDEFDPHKTPTLGGTVQRAIQVAKFAGPKRYLEHTRCVTDKPKPQLSAGEVLVRMRVRSVNPSDGLALMGIYAGFQPKKFPATPGNEGMGVVDELGEGVEGLEIGQRVVPLLSSSAREGEGSWQEYVKLPASSLLPIPDTVTDGAAAQLVVNPVTAYGMLKDFDPPKGAYLIQSAGGSAVGRIVIALAKQWGFKTLNLVRRREQVEELKALGGDEVICTSDEDVVRRVKEITGGQLAYGGIDMVAGGTTKLIVNSVRDGGTVFALGGFSSPDCCVPVGDLIFRGVIVRGWWLSRYLHSKSREETRGILEEVMGLVECGVIRLPEGEKYDLADYEKALKKQQEVGREGKVMLVG